jgi:hypothetical protein
MGILLRPAEALTGWICILILAEVQLQLAQQQVGLLDPATRWLAGLSKDAIPTVQRHVHCRIWSRFLEV